MITILTITARAEPMFHAMADSIAEAQKLCPVMVEWVVVDAVLWYQGSHRLAQLEQAVRGRIYTRHIPPKPSKWHGPWKDARLGTKELPDTNGARNTGLIHARGDFLILFDDCSKMSPGLLANACIYRDKNAAVAWWYDKQGDLHGEFKPRGDQPQECNPTSGFKGSGVGYPVYWLQRVNGWDEIYGGQRSGNDLELAVRAHRAGMHCFCDFTEGVLEQDHPHLHHFEAYQTSENDKRLEALIAGDQILPSGNDFDIVALRRKASEHRQKDS